MENEKQSDAEIIRQKLLKQSPFNTPDGSDLTACVGINGGYDQSTIIYGFKNAVIRLCNSVAEGEGEADALIYPILFCIRHSFELCLKGFLYNIKYIRAVKQNHDSFMKLLKARRINKKITKLHDDYDSEIKYLDNENKIEIFKRRKELLNKRSLQLNNFINSLSEIIFNNFEEQFTHDINGLIVKIIEIYDVDYKIQVAFDKLIPLLIYYKDVDPKGDAFRYWYDKENKPHFETKKIQHIRIDILAIQFEKITELFNELDLIIWYLIKDYETGTFTKELSREQIKEISQILPHPEEFTQKIKGIKDQIQKKYNISSNKFNDVLKIIRNHREFSSYMGKEIKFSCLSDEALEIFVKCSIGQGNWEELSKKISQNELILLYTFYDISGCRYQEKNYSYFSEDLDFLYSEIKKRRIGIYSINPVSAINHVLNGMKKCGQVTYASIMEQYMSKLPLEFLSN